MGERQMICEFCEANLLQPDSVKYCIYCGNELVEYTKRYICSNNSCKRHIENEDFGSYANYCDLCGLPVVRVG